MGLKCTPALRPALGVRCMGRSIDGEGAPLLSGGMGQPWGAMCRMPNFCLLRAVKSGPGHLALALGGGDGVFQNCLRRPSASQPPPAKEVALQRWKRIRKFLSVRSIPGCTKTLWGVERQSLAWPKMPKSVGARQRRSVSVTSLAQKYSPLVQCTEIKLPVEKELAQDLASLFWEGMGEEPEKQHANIHI